MNQAHPRAAASTQSSESVSEVFARLSDITRQLQQTLSLVGLPRLEVLTGQLPDARGRLNYITTKTGEAAEKVLNLVDDARGVQSSIGQRVRAFAQLLAADQAHSSLNGAADSFVADIEKATRRMNGHLSDIMVAQDFHDLTSQVVAKVLVLAADLEAQLGLLLSHTGSQTLQAPGTEKHMPLAPVPAPPATPSLAGPVTDAGHRGDVVTSQSQVDDMLADLGF